MQPRKLGKPGRELWRWIQDNYDIAGGEPLAVQLCMLVDRLAELRASLSEPKLTVADRMRLVNGEVKLVGAYGRLWRLLGLADKDNIPARDVGRPSSAGIRR